jgi:exoribonuclease II
VLDKRIIEFFHNKKISMALVLKSDLKHLYCLTEEGIELKIPPDKVLFDEPVPFDLKEDNHSLAQKLRALSESRAKLSESIDIRDLWEICLGEQESFSLDELSVIYFGKDCQHHDKSALFRLLNEDRTFFTRKKENYSPSTAEHVESLAHQRKMEETRARSHEIVGANFKAILEGRTNRFVPEAEEYIPALEDICIRKKESSRFKEISTILQKSGVNSSNAPFNILVRSGRWNEDENLLIREFDIEKGFTENLLEECLCIVASAGEPGSGDGYRDYTSLEAITIDDESTKDYDDALSYEEMGESIRIGIHIADISFFLTPETDLEVEARARGTSIYMPDLKIQMLPAVLSEDAASLREGHKRRTLTFFVTLSAEGEIRDYSIEKSIIRVSRRATYDEVDKEISREHPLLKKFSDFAGILFARRLQECSFHTPFPRLSVQISDTGEIIIKKEDPSRPSQVLVSEMMILANSLAGEFCAKNAVQAIYRVQDRPGDDMPKVDKFDLYTLSTLRKYLKKGTLSLTPARHHGLGIECYVQITSPLRRYCDLSMHRQIKHFMDSGVPLYNNDELSDIIKVSDRALEVADILERDRKNYWLLKYLEKQKGHELEAVVLRFYGEKMIVQLCETLCETDCPKPRGTEIMPGDLILVFVELVWPREGVVRLSFQSRLGRVDA